MTCRLVGPICTADGCKRPVWLDDLCSPCHHARRAVGAFKPEYRHPPCRCGGTGLVDLPGGTQGLCGCIGINQAGAA